MRIEIRMPELSASTGEADLLAWLVKPGDTVVAGDVIAELETDKSTIELEAECAGTVVEIRVPEGTSGVKVGELLALIETAEDTTGATPEASPPVQASERGRDEATALARRLAARGGIDLSSLRGSGSGGKVVAEDVRPLLEDRRENARAAAEVRVASDPSAVETGLEPPFREVPHSRIRRTIASRMSDAKQTVPHFYLRIECEIDELLAVRRELNQNHADLHLSLNDFVVRAAALALREVPAANVAWSENALIFFERADLAVAVATDAGLITPILRGADQKTLGVISSELKELVERARAGKLRPEEYRGGTFSISNLGMYGVESVNPILNPPQSGILGVGAGQQRPVVRDGRLAVGTAMTCTLSADHRAVDGAIGARFLAAFKRRIEDPLRMLL